MNGTADPNRYHHGSLRAALLDEVEAIVREAGIDQVTVRACSQRLGVSHAAAFRHFADKRAMLTAFASGGARELAAYMRRERDSASDPQESFLLTGIGYLRFAVDRPAAFQAVFRDTLLDPDDPDYLDAMSDLRALLLQSGDRLAGDEAMSPQALLAWSATHGLATLYVDGSLADVVKSRDPIRVMRDALRLLKPTLSEGADPSQSATA